jgi:hypothetical protein
MRSSTRSAATHSKAPARALRPNGIIVSVVRAPDETYLRSKACAGRISSHAVGVARIVEFENLAHRQVERPRSIIAEIMSSLSRVTKDRAQERRVTAAPYTKGMECRPLARRDTTT